MANTHIKHFALYEDVGELNNPDFVRMEKIERRSHLMMATLLPMSIMTCPSLFLFQPVLYWLLLKDNNPLKLRALPQSHLAQYMDYI